MSLLSSEIVRLGLAHRNISVMDFLLLSYILCLLFRMDPNKTKGVSQKQVFDFKLFRIFWIKLLLIAVNNNNRQQSEYSLSNEIQTLKFVKAFVFHLSIIIISRSELSQKHFSASTKFSYLVMMFSIKFWWNWFQAKFTNRISFHQRDFNWNIWLQFLESIFCLNCFTFFMIIFHNDCWNANNFLSL